MVEQIYQADAGRGSSQVRLSNVTVTCVHRRLQKYFFKKQRRKYNKNTILYDSRML